jgi:hypothetical protein
MNTKKYIFFFLPMTLTDFYHTGVELKGSAQQNLAGDENRPKLLVFFYIFKGTPSRKEHEVSFRRLATY